MVRKHWFSRKAAANRPPASFPAFPSQRGDFRLLFGDFHLRPYISCGSQAAHGSAFHAVAALITVVPNLVLVFRDHVWLRRFGDVRKEHSRSSFFSHHESCPDLLTFQFSWSLIASLLQGCAFFAHPPAPGICCCFIVWIDFCVCSLCSPLR